MSDAYTIGPASGGVGQSVSTVSLTFSYGGNTPGTVLSFTVTNPYSVLYDELKTLASGANTIAVPDKAGGVWIVPPASNAVAMTLKGVTGDTGISLHLTSPTFITFAVATSRTFCLTAGATLTDIKFVWV